MKMKLSSAWNEMGWWWEFFHSDLYPNVFVFPEENIVVFLLLEGDSAEFEIRVSNSFESLYCTVLMGFEHISF